MVVSGGMHTCDSHPRAFDKKEWCVVKKVKVVSKYHPDEEKNALCINSEVSGPVKTPPQQQIKGCR